MVSVAPQRKSSVIVRHSSAPAQERLTQFPAPPPPLSPGYSEHSRHVQQRDWIKQLHNLRKKAIKKSYTCHLPTKIAINADQTFLDKIDSMFLLQWIEYLFNWYFQSSYQQKSCSTIFNNLYHWRVIYYEIKTKKFGKIICTFYWTFSRSGIAYKMMECQKQQAELQHSLQFQSQQERLFGHFPRFTTSSSSFSSFQTSIRTSHANEEFPMRKIQIQTEAW